MTRVVRLMFYGLLERPSRFTRAPHKNPLSSMPSLKSAYPILYLSNILCLKKFPRPDQTRRQTAPLPIGGSFNSADRKFGSQLSPASPGDVHIWPIRHKIKIYAIPQLHSRSSCVSSPPLQVDDWSARISVVTFDCTTWEYGYLPP